MSAKRSAVGFHSFARRSVYGTFRVRFSPTTATRPFHTELMANARRIPGETDKAIAERLNGVARDLCSRAGEHFESVVLITTWRDSIGRQRSNVWTDGGEYSSYGAAKDFVIGCEERMRTNNFANYVPPPPDELV